MLIFRFERSVVPELIVLTKRLHIFIAVLQTLTGDDGVSVAYIVNRECEHAHRRFLLPDRSVSCCGLCSEERRLTQD